jgi:hypothetical protein
VTGNVIFMLGEVPNECIESIVNGRRERRLIRKLKNLGVNVTELGKRLVDVISKFIEVDYNPTGNKHNFFAGTEILIDRILGELKPKIS